VSGRNKPEIRYYSLRYIILVLVKSITNTPESSDFFSLFKKKFPKKTRKGFFVQVIYIEDASLKNKKNIRSSP